jgi:hypothetical protein
MTKMLTVVAGVVLLGFACPVAGLAADSCPPELAQAKAALKAAQNQKAKAQEQQPPRYQAGARSQDVQAPRSQDVQAPRSQDVQAPRIDKASSLIRQADAACKKGDMATSAKKAKDALGLLK